MKISLSKRMYVFPISCFLLFIILLGCVIWSSLQVDLAYSRANYAQQLDNQTNRLKQLVISDNIYANDYSRKRWQSFQVKLTTLLALTPPLTPELQTIQNSIQSQNESLKRVFHQIINNKLKDASSEIKQHLTERLITQLEAIRSDSLELSAIAHDNILSTITSVVIFLISISAVIIFVLLFGAYNLLGIVRKSLNEVKHAFDKSHSGHFEKIRISHQSEEFDTIVNAFNEMNEKLSETTVSLSVMQKVVEERTHVLEELSNTDPLTKVANRRSLFECANVEFTRAKRTNSELTLLLLDCDFFKEINDEFGHLVGDDFLVHICNICKNEIRDIDILGRYGGEEFVILLPHCDINGAIETAKRIQKSLAEHFITIDDKQIAVTLSIGISALNNQHKNLEQLINDADKAMYKAKKNGRNCIEVTTPMNLH